MVPVSYTHLRAHETDSYLVCRLLLEKKLQENLITYNSKVAASNKREEAIFSRIKGNIARQEARLAQIKTVASTGSSLMQMGGGSTTKPTYMDTSSASDSGFRY